MKTIAVVGAGSSGYLTVLYFCTKYPEYKINWIYPENNQPIGVGEGTVPQLLSFFKDMGIPLRTIIEEIGGSLKLGIKFENFKQETFYHPFGGPIEEKFELAYMMEHNRVPDNIENYDIAFHFSVATLAKFLDKWFKKFNNLTIERRTVPTVDEIDCDWIVDCTGFKRTFVNQYYNDNFKSIAHLIPNNKALVYRTAIPEHKRFAYTTCIGMKHGWIWNIPLKDEIGIGYVYSDEYDVKEEFLDYLEQEGFGRPELREVPMVTGRNKKHCVNLGNKQLVAVGLSSAFIEPLESTGLKFTFDGIKWLDELIRGDITHEQYDEHVNYEFDVTLDFIIAHYKYSHHTNEYWSFFKNTPIELYRRNKTFFQGSWAYILQDSAILSQLSSDEKYRIAVKHKTGNTYSSWFKNYISSKDK
jgi:tryptophan halogenase